MFKKLGLATVGSKILEPQWRPPILHLLPPGPPTVSSTSHSRRPLLPQKIPPPISATAGDASRRCRLPLLRVCDDSEWSCFKKVVQRLQNRIFQLTDSVEPNLVHSCKQIDSGIHKRPNWIEKKANLTQENLGQKKMIQFLLLVFCINRTFAVKCYVDNQVAISLNETFPLCNFAIHYMNKDAVKDNIWWMDKTDV